MIKFEDNIKMAYQIAWRFTPTTVVDREDIIQMALIGLHKAIKNYKEELGFKFSTYACKIMRNEILKELKRFKHHASLEEMELNVVDTSPTPEEEVLGALERFKSILTDREYTVIQLTIKGYNQKEISKQIKVSQSQVSRIFIKAKDKVKEATTDGYATAN